MRMVGKIIARLCRLVVIFLIGAMCQNKWAIIDECSLYLTILLSAGAVSGILAFVCEWILEFTNKSEV